MNPLPENTRPTSYRGLVSGLQEGCFGQGWMKQNWFLPLVALLGGLCWVLFLQGAHFSSQDWPKEMSYLAVLKHSLANGVIPWRTNQMLQQDSDHFLAIPEVIFSPQILLLWVLDLKSFVVANLLILYAVGYLGCVKLARRFQWSAFAFLFFVILFNFNGYLTSHLGVGHQMWETLFYLPWFFSCLFELLADPECRKSILKLALVLFLILLQGGIHQFVWCNMLLALLFIFRASLRVPLATAVLMAGLASSYRILPAVWDCWKLKHMFMSGYPDLNVLLQAFTTTCDFNQPKTAGIFNTHLGWWEYDAFVGLASFLALIWFGMVTAKTNRSPELAANLGLLGSAMLVIFYLSYSDVYFFFHQSHLPLLNSERVSSRFIILPFFLLLLLAADAMSRYFQNGGVPFRSAAAILLLGTCYQLYFHAFIWCPKRIEKVAEAPLTVNLAEIAGEPDAVYRSVIYASFLVSLASLAGIIYWWRRTSSRLSNEELA